MDDETWAHVRVTAQDQHFTQRLNSIELSDIEYKGSTDTSDYIISGDILQEEETKEQGGRKYKVVRSLLLTQKIILD